MEAAQAIRLFGAVTHPHRDSKELAHEAVPAEEMKCASSVRRTYSAGSFTKWDWLFARCARQRQRRTGNSRQRPARPVWRLGCSPITQSGYPFPANWRIPTR
jgi:hypothetical protein